MTPSVQHVQPNYADLTAPAVSVVTEIGGWIKHADAKCGFILAADLALGTALSSMGARVATTCSIDSALVLIGFLSLVVSIVAIILALFPRTATLTKTIFDWPELSTRKEPIDYPRDEKANVADLWSHAWTLSQIARAKYRAVGVAMMSNLVALILGLTWLLTAAPTK